MAGNPENKRFTERLAEGARNLFIVGALIGVVAMLANMEIGATIFERSAVGAAASEGARRLIRSNNK